MEASGSGSIKNDDMDNDDDNNNNNNKDLVGIEYNSNNVKKARLLSTLSALIDDPILADVPRKPSLSDVDTLISLELGSAMRISILKLDGSSVDVVVMDTATVKDLKESINKKINETEQSKMGHRHISWRHVWSNFCLSYHNDKLLNDNTALQDYGVRNNSQYAIRTSKLVFICNLHFLPTHGAICPPYPFKGFSKAFKKKKTPFLPRSQQKDMTSFDNVSL